MKHKISTIIIYTYDIRIDSNEYEIYNMSTLNRYVCRMCETCSTDSG